ncbi:phosphoglycerate mutase-like protein 4 isoform X2 [Solanum stenotomum]|uniref:phosphoglycerate mutase-like protein 4 isoform X2 n=1 Tax=Solanum stenotomum TaxID=172797 RepID=UPI0020D1B4DF|nr:phosphoglycerate mutase-like protein 4 isoform X2 [Solanum stenotomum]
MISFRYGESLKPDIHMLLRHSQTSHFCCSKLSPIAAISKHTLRIPALRFNSIPPLLHISMADSTSRVISQPECGGDAKSENVSPSFTEIIVIRHGETEWNADGRIQGHLDVELNDIGRQQATAVAARLSKEPRISVIYSSDLKRAHETAEIIARSCGDLEGGGESLDQLYQRCISCLQRIAKNHQGKRVVVVSHGGAIRALHMRASPHRRSKSKIWNTSVGILHLSDKDEWTVKLWADVSHLNKTEFLNSGFGGDKTSG